MERIGIRELRQHASEWVRRAQAGERVEITRRGEVVAVLAPPPEGDVVARLRRDGRLRDPLTAGALPEPLRLPRSASHALDELRADER